MEKAEIVEKKYKMLFDHFPVWAQLRARAVSQLKAEPSASNLKELEKADRTITYYLSLLWKDNEQSIKLLNKGLLFNGTVYKELEKDKSQQGVLLFNAIKTFGPALQVFNPRIRELRSLVQKQINTIDMQEVWNTEEKMTALLKDLDSLIQTEHYNQFIGFTTTQASSSRELKYELSDQDSFWVIVKIISVLHIYWQSVGAEITAMAESRRKFMKTAALAVAGVVTNTGLLAAIAGSQTFNALSAIENMLKKKVEALPTTSNYAIFIAPPKKPLEKLGMIFVNIYIYRVELAFGHSTPLIFMNANKNQILKAIHDNAIEHIVFMGHGSNGICDLAEKDQYYNMDSFLSNADFLDPYGRPYKKNGYFLKHTCSIPPGVAKAYALYTLKQEVVGASKDDLLYLVNEYRSIASRLAELCTEREVLYDGKPIKQLKLKNPQDLAEVQAFLHGANFLLADTLRDYEKRDELNSSSLSLVKKTDDTLLELTMTVVAGDLLNAEIAVTNLLKLGSFTFRDVTQWNRETDPVDFIVAPGYGTSFKDANPLDPAIKDLIDRNQWLHALLRKLAMDYFM